MWGIIAVKFTKNLHWSRGQMRDTFVKSLLNEWSNYGFMHSNPYNDTRSQLQNLIENIILFLSVFTEF
jgi:hypothetical protein